MKQTQAQKTKQIVVRFDKDSYDMISMHAKIEHRGIGEFVRHATLDYIEVFEWKNKVSNGKGWEVGIEA